jgi:methyl-accepting chemotaxis protein
MKNWTISKRITFGFSLLTLLAVLVGLIGYVSLKTLRSDAHVLLGDSMPGTLYLSEAESNLAEEYGLMESYIRSNDPQERNEIEAQVAARDKKNAELRDLYAAKIERDEDRTYFAKLTDPTQKFAASKEELLNLSKSGDKERAYAFLNSSYLPSYRAYKEVLSGYVDLNRRMSKSIGVSVEQSVKSAADWILAVLIAVFLIAITISKLIVSGTNKVLNHVIDSIDTGSAEVAAAATQTSAASNALAEGASEQASSLEETSSSLEEIASMTSSNAVSAQHAKDLANEMRKAADGSTAQMKEMENAMAAIKESSAGISAIIKTIDEIAFQTNILALNAAVEAARAGEAGAGFAVVAEEVRNLAQRSAQSAKETSGKIEGAVSNSERGVAISTRVAESLAVINGKAGEMHAVVSEIANASDEQNKGIGQLTSAVQEMDKVTQTNAASAEETASASEELNSEAASLRDSVTELASLVRKSGRNSLTVKTPRKTAKPSVASSAKKVTWGKTQSNFLPMNAV